MFLIKMITIVRLSCCFALFYTTLTGSLKPELCNCLWSKHLIVVKGFKYAGVQNGTQCWCGNSYGSHGNESNSECYVTCAGDDTLRCEAPWMNSIYDKGFWDDIHEHKQHKWFEGWEMMRFSKAITSSMQNENSCHVKHSYYQCCW